MGPAHASHGANMVPSRTVVKICGIKLLRKSGCRSLTALAKKRRLLFITESAGSFGAAILRDNSSTGNGLPNHRSVATLAPGRRRRAQRHDAAGIQRTAA